MKRRSKTRKYSRSTNGERAGHTWGRDHRLITSFTRKLGNFLEPQTDSAVSVCSSENEEQVGVLLLLTSQVDRR